MILASVFYRQKGKGKKKIKKREREKKDQELMSFVLTSPSALSTDNFSDTIIYKSIKNNIITENKINLAIIKADSIQKLSKNHYKKKIRLKFSVNVWF